MSKYQKGGTFLILPRVNKEVTTEGSSGITTAQVLVDGEVAAEKIMAVCGDSWRVLEMSVTIDQAGEHTISLGGITKTINVAE